jgi:hypothetical protein
VDRSKFRPGDWLLLAGGAVMLIFGLALDWTTSGGLSADNAFDYFFTGGISWLLVVGAGIIAVLLAVDAIRTGTTPWPLLLVLGTGLATVLMFIRLLLGGRDDFNRGAGMWVAFFAAAVAFAGAVMNFTTSGGKLSDLTDIDKLRSAFRGSAGRSMPPPPPPPPTSTTPPGPAPPPPPSP